MSQIILLSCTRQTRSSVLWTLLSQPRKPSITIRRCLSTVTKPEKPPVTMESHDTSFQFLSEASKTGQAEDTFFDEQVRHVESWWASERFKGIKRPYSVEDVVSKRGALQQTYPSSLMARKLFTLLEERAAKGKPLHTKRAKTPYLDYMRPIIADGDTGYAEELADNVI
ncbi:mitochondrial 2-methylisocitrate lyase [Ascochyta clinopodiicola]|nr:mitochondrial 2-methylisocitrate lyase [Ascochyta clinopodiicola]